MSKETGFQMAGEGQVRTRQAAGVMNLLRLRTRLDVRTHFFSVRTVDSWNCLPDRIKLARSIGQFKQLHKQHRSNRTRQETNRLETGSGMPAANNFHNGPRWPDRSHPTSIPSHPHSTYFLRENISIQLLYE